MFEQIEITSLEDELGLSNQMRCGKKFPGRAITRDFSRSPRTLKRSRDDRATLLHLIRDSCNRLTVAAPIIGTAELPPVCLNEFPPLEKSLCIVRQYVPRSPDFLRLKESSPKGVAHPMWSRL